MRNPGRTAATSAALMVGLGLVVFVAVFAAALKSSFSDQLDRLVRADVFITDQSLRPVARGVEPRMDAIPGVEASMPLYYDQIEVDGRESNLTIDALDGVDPAKLRSVYAFEWVEGSDALVARLHGDRALIEEQFAKRHGLAVGDRYRVRTPSGGRGSFTVLGIYRDPTMLQGSLVAIDALRPDLDRARIRSRCSWRSPTTPTPRPCSAGSRRRCRSSRRSRCARAPSTSS